MVIAKPFGASIIDSITLIRHFHLPRPHRCAAIENRSHQPQYFNTMGLQLQSHATNTHWSHFVCFRFSTWSLLPILQNVNETLRKLCFHEYPFHYSTINDVIFTLKSTSCYQNKIEQHSTGCFYPKTLLIL